MAIEPVRLAKILYTNWKGEVSWREVIPLEIHFGVNQWHREAQWLLDAYDWEKKAVRSFAMNSVHAWESGDEVSFDFSTVRS